jgi:MFS family permease
MTRRWWALGAVILAVLAAGLDATVLAVALPTLAAVLHASESDLPPPCCRRSRTSAARLARRSLAAS